MKGIICVLVIALAGCSTMTPGQKKFTQIAAGVLIVGAIAAHGNGSSTAPTGSVGGGLPCRPQPDGTCR